jgi:hypothetical protein
MGFIGQVQNTNRRFSGYHSRGGGARHTAGAVLRSPGVQHVARSYTPSHIARGVFRSRGVQHASRSAARRAYYARGTRRPLTTAGSVRAAQQEVLKALHASPRKLPPFRLIDPLTAQGRKSTSKSIAKVKTPQGPKLVASNKQYHPQSHVIWDHQSRTLFEYHAPPAQKVIHNIKRLFKGSPAAKQKAVQQLRTMGVVTGGQPSAKYIKFLGHSTPSVGIIQNRNGAPQHVASLHEHGPATEGIKHYTGTTISGVPFYAVSAPGRPITMVRGPVTGREVQASIGNVVAHAFGTDPASQQLQNAGLPEPVRVVKKGILGGASTALGAVGEGLDRPLAATEAALGKGLVAGGFIHGKTARKINRARGPLTAFLHGRGNKGVSGGDITQGLVGVRQLGITVDLAADPTLWVSFAALPETGGATSAVIAERLGKKLGLDALKHPKLVALARDAHATKNFVPYERALRDLAKTHNIHLPRNVLKTGWGQRLLKDIRKRPTQKLLDQIHTMQPVTVTPRRRWLTRKLHIRQQAKPAQFHVIGKPGLDAVTNITNSVTARASRPGFRFQVMTPLGRTHLPFSGRKLPGFNVPIPARVASMRGTGGLFVTQRSRAAFQREQLARVETKYAARVVKEVQPLEAMARAALRKHDDALYAKLTQQIERKTNEIAAARLAEKAKVEKGAKLQLGRSLQDVVRSHNGVRLQRQTSQFAQDYGRVVRARLDQAFAKATSTEGMSAPAAQAARIRVYLHMAEKEATGDNAILGHVLNLTPQEQRIEANLRAVYDDMLRHGKEIGVMDKGVADYAGTRLWSDQPNNPRNIQEVSQQVDQITGLGAHGAAPSHTRHRTAASVFDLASPHEVAASLVTYAGVDHTTATALADKLWQAGRFRVHAELAARKLQRGFPVTFDASLHPEQRKAIINSTRLTPKGGAVPVPLLDVAPVGSERRSVTLGSRAEQSYGFKPQPFAAFPEHQARAGKLLSAMEDRQRVQELLKGATGQRKVALQTELKDLQQQIKTLDANVNTLPADVQSEIAAMRSQSPEALIMAQLGSNAMLPKDLMQSTVISDSGVLWMVPEGMHKVPPGLPPMRPNEAGMLENPLDYASRLPDMRQADMMPVLDPKLTNFYSTRAQGRAAAYKARWGGIDNAVGRSSTEATQGRVTLPDGSQTTSDALRATKHDVTGRPTAYTDNATGLEHAAADMHFHEQTLLANHDHSIYYDPRTLVEYRRPTLPDGGSPVGVAPDRLWPTQTIADARAELQREGEYDAIVRTGVESGFQRAMGYMRYGVTTPFPAYHIRNLISDALKSLQADPGVVFHPIVNTKLLLAAGAPEKAAKLTINIPGHGRVPVHDFLLLADITGVRSGHHVAEIYQLFSSPALSESRVRRGLQQLNKINPASPNSFFGHTFTAAGVRREDIIRFQTFIQRMRRNGGDAADAAMYMIRHHFNYNDLSAVERRFARNVFLFYTWYRKNIPLQLAELVRRPGFFAAVAHSYRALQRGETPFNQDWSQISPWLPNMSGEMPQSGAIPDYYKDRLLAAGMNWNGHAVMVGFGAPWADLQLLSAEGVPDVMAMTNPVIGSLYQILAGKDLLLGRTFHASESSGIATLLDSLGVGLPKDAQGQPILPFWLNVIGGSLPLLGRGSGAIPAPSPFRDTGTLSTWSKRLLPITGLNTYVGPVPGSPRERGAIRAIVRGRAAERGALSQSLGNLSKHDRNKALHQFDKQTHVWAKEHHIPTKFLKQVQRSGFYVSPTKKGKAGSVIQLGTQFPGKSSGGVHLGGSAPKNSGGIHLGGGSLKSAETQFAVGALKRTFANAPDLQSMSALKQQAVTPTGAPQKGTAYKPRVFAHPQRPGTGLAGLAQTLAGTADSVSTILSGHRPVPPGGQPSVLLKQYAKHGVTGAGGKVTLSAKDAKTAIHGLIDLGYGNGQIVSHLTGAKLASLGQPAQLVRAMDVLKHVSNIGPAVPSGVPKQYKADVAKYGSWPGVQAEAKKYHLTGPELLAKIAKGESGFVHRNPDGSLHTSGLASGLAQFTPGNQATYKKKYGVDVYADGHQAFHGMALYMIHQGGLANYNRGAGQGYMNYILGQNVGTSKPTVKLTPKQKAAVHVAQRASKAWRALGSGAMSHGPGKLVGKANDAPGVPTKPFVLNFAKALSAKLGRAITLGTGSNHGPTNTGNPSQHQTGNAIDLPMTGASLTQAGHAALELAGMPRAQAQKASGGIYNVGGYQIIFNTYAGGNHFTHLHVGIRDGMKVPHVGGHKAHGAFSMQHLSKPVRQFLQNYAPQPSAAPAGPSGTGAVASTGGGGSGGGSAASSSGGKSNVSPATDAALKQLAALAASTGSLDTSGTLTLDDQLLSALMSHRSGKSIVSALLGGSTGSAGTGSIYNLPRLKLHI